MTFPVIGLSVNIATKHTLRWSIANCGPMMKQSYLLDYADLPPRRLMTQSLDETNGNILVSVFSELNSNRTDLCSTLNMHWIAKSSENLYLVTCVQVEKAIWFVIIIFTLITSAIISEWLSSLSAIHFRRYKATVPTMVCLPSIAIIENLGKYWH